ncbi:hypothetical protein C2845_PM12G22060 [Panicum miliaceum]|uniref:Uncharacterized protein n=1 Tax=Panicum miliaceum TaxID=4540 RepID=A0A3L6QJ37_PANMI|nr:hypothetical protein C2845_PM12G22060 [Panicum miliaceum]
MEGRENSDHLLCRDRDPVPGESDAFLVVLKRGDDDDERAGLIDRWPAYRTTASRGTSRTCGAASNSISISNA